MIFNSFHFFIFFPIVTILYFLLPYKIRWAWLLLASCYFYMVFIPYYILILGFTIIVDYFAGILIEQAKDPRQRKLFLICSIVANVGVLAFYKYLNFLNEIIDSAFGLASIQNPIPYLNIILPIGLSFHTFQAMSYTIEIYRGNFKAGKHFGLYSLYVMFYPQLVAGPIERPQNVLPQFYKKNDFEYERTVEGLKLMTWGFFKKIVIADNLSPYVDLVYNDPSRYHGLPVIIATIFFAFQIYCDFSGYSDIALGSARIMGFDLMRNFNRPYFSMSVKEFWSRWHISLSSWFRDYLYIPLGGNRVVKWRWYYNLFITFLISGLWHGANWTFMVWGALHGFYLIAEINILEVLKRFGFEKRLQSSSVYSFFSLILTFILVCIAWVFFRAASVEDGLTILKNSLDINFSKLGIAIGSFSKNNIILVVIMILVMEVIQFFQREQSFPNYIRSCPKPLRWAVYYFLLGAIIFFGKYSNAGFIYFQF